MRRAAIAGLCLATAVAGAVIGHVRMPDDLATLRSPEIPMCQTEDSPGPCRWDAGNQGNGKGTSFTAPPEPYCMVDRENPTFLTVSGPSGGRITVNNRRVGELALVDAIDYGNEVAPDAGPFDGIQYNIPGPGVVAVDDVECVTT